MYINTPITREFIVAVAVSKRHAADWATRFLILFFPYFFISGPCSILSWPSRQLLSAR